MMWPATGPASVWALLVVAVVVGTVVNGQSSRRRNRNRNRNRTTARPASGNSDFDAVLFLENTGYLDQLPPGSHAEASVNNAITEFQRFTGIPVSGVIDRRTVQKMQSPRCGVADVIRPALRPQGLRGNASDPATPLAFNAPGYKWDDNDVTYKFTSYTRQLGGQQQINAIQNAFQKWAEVTPLNFIKQDRGTVNMDIGFGRGDHGDGAGNAFDGRGRTLAHAFFPGQAPIAGDTHFDDDEEWTLGTNDGTNLEIVAAHEFGHALGLGHSSDPTALMAPYYQGYDPNWGLKQDDIAGVQSLYGRRTGGRATTTRAPPRTTTRRPRRTTTRRPRQTTTRRPRRTTAPPTSNCDMRFDAVEQVHDGLVYAFRRRFIYRVGRSGVYDKRLIADVFPGCPGGVGGVVYDRYRRKLFVFKGRRYYRFTGYTMDPGYPKRLPNDFFFIKAAFQWVNGAIYVFKDRDKYAHWSESLQGYSRGFPQTRRSKWEGMPINIDAAFRSNDGYYYIFKYSRYWRYNSRADLSPGYPRDSGPVWLNCHTTQNQSQPQRILSDSDFSFLATVDQSGEPTLQQSPAL